MVDPKNIAKPVEDARRRRLLDAAITVFLRFGFRKASMDEVARAADVSRQGLYLHFATKEALFRETLEHVLETSARQVEACLGDESLPLEARLSGAFDAWVGRFAGTMGADASDLGEAAGGALKDLVPRHEAQFLDAVTKAIRASGLVAAYKPVGLSARQLADTLNATARGLKYASASREAFKEGMGVAVRALCMPLGASR
ncbi:TetR/AcrR family transcriptional regulator [Myxococcus sp. K15C18031901]|uniref:TetR/AcrR family transcriptional regulator n=1 Tax=Myxococcus dinghuensis TaxID=2906761 RepID=UPI0020A7C64F|nr:TetR/AcrR family transcriptional regulator [Myxococcus dinghuensis]MCP3103905.1 TetR/AcrR family transcriptional regulator [Myxococcus dinghuensis]